MTLPHERYNAVKRTEAVQAKQIWKNAKVVEYEG